MNQFGLHSVSIDGGRMSSSLLDNQDGQSRTMDDFERLAAGVADDFNNLLTVIAGYSDLLLGQEELSADGRMSAQEIKNAAERAFAVTRKLLSFSRKQSPQPKLVPLTSLIQGMAPLLRRLLGGDIALETVVTRGVPWVNADPVQIEWMFMNLAAHARDAMPGGGNFRIEFQCLTRDADAVVRVIATDTSCGMDAEAQAHLFEPFFTTKQLGQGMGFRLAHVYGVVIQNHGSIRVSSEVGQGTTFTIDLPAAPEPQVKAEERGLQQAGLRGTDRVLVVEGEQAARTVLRWISWRTGLVAWKPKTASRRNSRPGEEQGQ
jgi:two-component system, cell cycle sensor histidine kinase and response regulator CckA